MQAISFSGSTSHCKQCNVTFANYIELKRHLLTLKHKNGGILQAFRCKICSKLLRSKAGASKHLKDIHKKKLRSSYKCAKCPRTFPWKSGLLRHSLIHISKIRRDCCPFCGELCCQPNHGKSYNLRHKLNNHRCSETGSARSTTSVRRPASQPRIQFNVCNQTVRNTDHQSNVQRTEMKSFSCDKCDKSFRLRITLAYHHRQTHPVQELEDESVATSANSEPNICPANRSTSSSQSSDGGSAAQEATTRVRVLQAIQTRIAAEEKVIAAKLREAAQLEGQIKGQKMIVKKVTELTGTNPMNSGTGQVDTFTAEYIVLRIEAEKGEIVTKVKNLETLRQDVQSLQSKVEAWRLLLE